MYDKKIEEYLNRMTPFVKNHNALINNLKEIQRKYKRETTPMINTQKNMLGDPKKVLNMRRIKNEGVAFHPSEHPEYA